MKDIIFIKETLTEAIGWADYADDYFKEKHNLKKDQEDVEECIKILDAFEARSCHNCRIYSEQDECITKLVNFLDETKFHCNEWEART